MDSSIKLSEQQFQVIQAVNKLGGASAKQVQQELKHLQLAHTTVATLLSRLEKRGLFSSELKGRERVFHSQVDENSIQRSMVDTLISTVFKGDSTALMAHLVSEAEIDSDELEELRRLVQKGKDDD